MTGLTQWHGVPAPEKIAMEGHYVRLEPLNVDTHGDQLFRAVSGADAERLHRWLPDNVPEDRSAFQDWLVEKVASIDPLFFVVVDKATGRVTGRQALMDISTAHGCAEIGHILWGPEMAGTRLATEAFFLFANYIFQLGYRRYQWRCNSRNAPSRKAAERFGYKFEGIFRQNMVVKGESRDTAWFSIIDSEWEALRRGYLKWLDPENFEKDGQQRIPLRQAFEL